MQIARRKFNLLLVATLSGVPVVCAAESASAQSPQTPPPVVTSVALQTEGDLIATAGDDHQVRIWNSESGVLERRLNGHIDWVRSVAFSPTADLLVTAGNDRRLVLWKPTTGKEIAVIKQPQTIACVRFHPNGETFATVGFDNSLRIYDAETGAFVRQLACTCTDIRCLDISADGNFIAAAGRDGKVRVWNFETGKVVRDYPIHRRRVRGLQFSPDGATIATAAEDGSVCLTPVAGGASERLPRVAAKAMSLTYLPGGMLATGCSDNAIRIWNPKTREEIKQLSGHTGSVGALAAKDGVLASGSYDASVRYWNSHRVAANDDEAALIGSLPPATQGR